MTVTGPTMVRRQLGRKLRALREAADLTPAAVGKSGIISSTTVWRQEAGKVPIKTKDIWALCRLYKVTDEAVVAKLEDMARGSNQIGWWESYSDVVPAWFEMYVGLEAEAAQIWTFEDSVVPGELQTPDYAREVFRAARPVYDEDAIERYVKLRLERQDALFGRDPSPDLLIILGEGVLHRTVGGEQVQNAQLEHLLQLNTRANIDIRYLPFSAGAHAAMTGAFRVLDFALDEDPDIAYLESEVGGQYLEEPTQVSSYRRLFQMITKQAVPIGEYKL